MIRRYAVLAAALVLPLFAGCAAPVDGGVETTSDSTEALSGANGTTYVLTNFDGAAQFMGLNNQGKQFTASYGATTSFKLAALDKYQPGDPCRIAASSYNASVAVNDTVGFNATLGDMAANSCMAKVLLDKANVIKTFQPAP
jgi:hypothetical protein